MVLAKNFQLSEPQHSLLSKGLSFIPTLDIGKDQSSKLQLDLQNYHRKIKLAVYYRDSKKKIKKWKGAKFLPFVRPSGWSPSMHLLPAEVQELISEDLEIYKKSLHSVPEKFNLSMQEVKALRELKKAKHIVIKPADKGSAVVIMSREQYILEAERQLNDPMYYTKLKEPLYIHTVPMIVEIANTLKKKKYINSKQRQYLMGDLEPRERRFYILPKIHKDPQKWTIPFQVPPGRPIVSDCGSETYYTAEFLDYYLNPLSVKHPAYVKDTYHFIEIVQDLRISSEFYFFSMDVASLYTNIPIVTGIQCVKKIFEKYPDPKRPDEELLQLLQINLTRNDFVFNNKYYLQIKGTAMGKKFAPAYANIFMANWEEEVFEKCKKRPKCYLRYLDDIWGIWIGSKEEFFEFVNILNSHDPSIKLETEISEQSIDFLDTTVFKGSEFSKNHKLDIKVYFKKTDTHALVNKTSFHPRHTFRGVVKSQLLRFKRICTTQEGFEEAVRILFKALRTRGYSRSFLRNVLRHFLDNKRKEEGNLIPLITTFSSVAKDLNFKWKTNFYNILGKEGLLPDMKVISAYRRNLNLKDILVQARLPSLTKIKPQMLEMQFVRLNFVRNTMDKTIIPIEQRFNSRSKNCVYVIFCNKCGLKYVGETKNTLSTRMTQHRYNIKNNKEVETPLVKHFLFHGLEYLRIAGLQKDINWTDWERKKKERFWIFRLGTREPYGLNLKVN